MLDRHGYIVNSGYMGWCPDIRNYRLFATENEYNEWYIEYERNIV